MKTPTDAKVISTQRYLDESIVAQKSAAKDYEVTLSRETSINGRKYQMVLDGHHSLEAAARDGVEPVFIRSKADEFEDLAESDPEKYLESHWGGDDPYDVSTGKDVIFDSTEAGFARTWD